MIEISAHPSTTVGDSDVAATRLPGLSIVLPCFNEAVNVADAIRSAAAAADRSTESYEVIVVDDGSTDRTADVAARLAAADARVRLVIHATNRGYGAALRTGIRAARMPWVLLTDADLQFDLSDLADFVPCTSEADLVVGWRILRQDPAHRRATAGAWNWLMRRLFRLPVRDVDCAFKLIRRELLDGVTLTSAGAMISTELLVRAIAAGARVREVGVRHRPRVAGAQSGNDPKVVLRAFRELMAERAQLRDLARAAVGGRRAASPA